LAGARLSGVSTAVVEAQQRPSACPRPTGGPCPGHRLSGRSSRQPCRARKSLAQPKTRVLAIAYSCDARDGLLLLVAPAQRRENTPHYVQFALAITFGFEGKNGIGTDTDAADVVPMGARLYDPATGRFLQVDPDFGGSANAYDSVGQDPLNGSDPTGLSGGWNAATLAYHNRQVAHAEYCKDHPDGSSIGADGSMTACGQRWY
jgi:RHS repeat-associated protein